MRQLQPVIWMKGTFLSPQHLQAQDRFIENSLHFRLESLSSSNFGFLTLQIDREALAAGVFVILEASGMFPDGLLFDCPASEPPPLSKPLAEHFGPDQASIDVFLAIPNHRQPGVNVSMAKSHADTRYLAEAIMVRDENSGLSERAVQVARKNYRLLVGDESRQECSVLQVARVDRTESGILQLDPRFVPPLLDFVASDYVSAIARRTVEILSAKSSMLAGLRRQKNLSLAEFGVSDVANFWLLYTINSHLPLFRHMFETRHGHPEKLFHTMSSLAGCLMTFSSKVHPRDLPIYAHDRLSECFSNLDEMIQTLLETVIPANFVSLPFKLTQPSFYATGLAEDKYLFGTKMYLAIQADMNEAELINKVPYLLKVCSTAHLEHLVRQALPGVALTHVPRPPSSIPVKVNYQYFSLTQSGVAWEAVERARSIAVYVPGDFAKPQLELVILLPDSTGNRGGNTPERLL